METQAHGALIEILDIGVLLLGRSGVGKSECALELVRRGHRLVADDVVKLRAARRGDGPEEPASVVVGEAPELIRHYMEIRGLGLIHVPDLFGADSVRTSARIDLVCRLEEWTEGADYERIGLERERAELAGVSVPAVVLPVRAAGSMATLIEVAVRDLRERRKGNNAAVRLDARLRGQVSAR